MNRRSERVSAPFIAFMGFMFAAGALFAQEKMLSRDASDLSLQDLYNIKVSIASKTEEKISDAPGVISVITQDELKRFGGTTLSDILKRVPSFLGTTTYMTDRSVIASRGDQVTPASNHVLLLLNGRPMREIMEGGIKSEVYESFPVSGIDHIEVIRGPGSVLYGSQAFSSVINVVTKKPDNNTVSVSGALGEGLKNNIMADLQYKFGDLGLVVAGRYADKGGWKLKWDAPGLFPGMVHHVDVSLPDYGPGVYAELSYKDLRYMCSYNQWENEFFMPDYELMVDIQPGTPDMRAPVGWKKFFNDLECKHEFSKVYTTSLNLTYTGAWLDATGLLDRKSYEIIGEWTNYITPVDHLNIALGAVWGFMTGKESVPNNPVPSLDNQKQNTFSGYTQVDYRWDWCKVIGGFQANKVADFDVDFNPRAGLIFYPLEHINIKTLYSTAYRAPSMDELYLDHPGMKGKLKGQFSNPMIPYDDNLKPEKVQTFDVGANYQNENIEFGFNAFHSQMKNLIFQDRYGKFIVPTYDNLGKVTIFGLECEGKYYLTRSVLFEGSVLYQQSKDDVTGVSNVAPLPDFSAKGGLSYKAEYGLTVSAFNTFQQALNPKYKAALNKQMKEYNMTNVHCSYDLNKLFHVSQAKDLCLVLNIDNLLDTEVWLPTWGLSPGSVIPYNQGRTIYCGFKVAF
jgi:outer membrane receptor for ferrienterochelin and colicins